MSEPLLQVKSISKRYGSLMALENISFDLHSGEIIGLVGRSGAGKTSLINVIGGLSPQSDGEIAVRGQNARISNPAQARALGIELIHHEARLVKQLDILQNIFLGREICRHARFGLPDWDRMHDRAIEILAGFDLNFDIFAERTSNLNAEQRQIIAIARSLCVDPCLLLLDDALASLSYPRQQVMLERLKWLAADRGTGILISGDNLKHLFSVTNRILVLYEGQLVANMPTGECTPRDIVELIVGTSSREHVTPVIWALESYHAAQRQFEDLHRAQAALHHSLEASDSQNRALVKQLSEQVKALDKLNAALQETQRRLMIESEENRKELSRELHDQVIQDLLSFNYRLEEMEESISAEPQRQELCAVRDGIRQVVSDLRQVCRDLRPPTIDNHGLPSAIRSLAQEWAERNSINLQLNIDPELGRVPEPIELSVFRIVQEGLSNIRKHAHAKNVELTLYRTPSDNLLIRLFDDGSGLSAPPDLADLSANKHFGLLGISERAALLGGTMQIMTPEDKGMILQVEIPSPYPSV